MTEDFRPPHFSETELYFSETELCAESEGLSESTEPMFGSIMRPPSLAPHAVQHWLSHLADLRGFVAAVLIDTDAGTTLGATGESSVVLNADATVQLARVMRRATLAMGLGHEIDDVTTYGEQIHLLHSLRESPNIFCSSP